MELILGQNGLSAALVDLFLLGDQISTNYFKEKLTKKFPNVIGVPNAIESKILKSIFAEIASNLYELEVVGKKPAVEVPFSQELKEGNTGPTQEKEKKGPPPIKTGLTLPGISTQGFGSTLPQTPPVVKVPISTAPSKVEDAPRVQVKPVTPTTVEKFVIPTQVAKAVPPPPEVRLDSKQSLPPKSTIPDLPGSLTLQGRLAKKIQQNYPDAEVKKVDKDNYVDIFIPSVYPKRGAHLFFNTSKDEIKIGFYCRDEEFIKGVLAKQPTLEAYSQGIRPKGNKSYSSVEESISATFDFLSKIVGKLELPPDQKNEPRKGPPPIISVSTNRVPPPPPPPPPIKKK
ncbi:MAG: hypothetical protein ACO21G_11600, partial [Algoriphagus sp.]